MNYEIRSLGVADANEYRRVRLDALRLHPEAFGSDYAEEAALPSAQFVQHLTARGLTRFGGFAQGSLVGLATLSLESRVKVQHKAHLFGMYVDSAHRGTGLARRLVEAVIAGAREGGAVVLDLSVTAGNEAAQRLYRQMGFVPYGLERRAFKIDDRYLDSELMALDLD